MPAPADDRPSLLISGASGLIGSRLVEAFREKFSVIAVDVEPLPPKLNGVAGVEWVRCDLTSDEAVSTALDRIRARRGGNLAGILHLAAYYDFSGEPSPLYRELTVEGTRRLLRGLQAFRVDQFVFSSTLLVQQPSPDDQPITAQSPVAATWDYPRSKLEAERVIAAERGSIPTVILRIAGVYDVDCRSIPIAQQIARIYERRLESYLFPGDQDSGQAFVHLDDLVECFRAVVAHRERLPEESRFIIGEENVLSYRELQELLGQQIHGQKWPTIRIPKIAAKAGAWLKDKFAADSSFIKPWMIDLADQHYPISTRKAREQLGWYPQHSLQNTLPDMIARLHADPRGWYRRNGLPLPSQLDRQEARGESS